MKRGLLILEKTKTSASRSFPGILRGAEISALKLKSNKDKGFGEIVFNTSMTGYQEILTDPSYYGEIICMTTSHVGSTGINPEDFESKKAWCAGFIVRDFVDQPSNWRSTQSLESFLIENGIPALTEVDTRALTRHIRKEGAIRGVILPEEEKDLAEELLNQLPSFEGRDLIKEVSTDTSYVWTENSNEKKYKVVAVDYGIKWNLLRSLEQRGCQLEVVPATMSAEEILSKNPDGIFLSNGPGDPSAAPYAVDTVKGLLGKKPIFGVCMGHQILCLALGGKTFKMKFGHRGGNQPVKDLESTCVEISSHNHGFAVTKESLPSNTIVTHLNLNDQTVEGISVPDLKAFSVQYHPEACPGPHDSVLLFDRFINLMG